MTAITSKTTLAPPRVALSLPIDKARRIRFALELVDALEPSCDFERECSATVEEILRHLPEGAA